MLVKIKLILRLIIIKKYIQNGIFNFLFHHHRLLRQQIAIHLLDHRRRAPVLLQFRRSIHGQKVHWRSIDGGQMLPEFFGGFPVDNIEQPLNWINSYSQFFKNTKTFNLLCKCSIPCSVIRPHQPFSFANVGTCAISQCNFGVQWNFFRLLPLPIICSKCSFNAWKLKFCENFGKKTTRKSFLNFSIASSNLFTSDAKRKCLPLNL